MDTQGPKDQNVTNELPKPEVIFVRPHPNPRKSSPKALQYGYLAHDDYVSIGWCEAIMSSSTSS